MALGADRGRVIGLVMCEAGFLLMIGLIAGTALALWTARAASTLLFGLKPYDPATLVTACAVLAASAWWQAIRRHAPHPASIRCTLCARNRVLEQ